MTTRFSWLLLCAPLIGCEAGPEPTHGPARTPEAGPTPLSKTLDVSVPTWPARSSIDQATRGVLSEATLARLDRSAIPVLVPKQAALLQAPGVVVKPAYYSLALPGAGEHAGVNVVVSATRVSHRYADIPPVKGNRSVRGLPAFITENEGIWSVTWFEHGVSYVVEVECARPSEDARCADAAFVSELAEGLVFIGGSFGDGVLDGGGAK